jgi:hypothetical protein
MDHGVRNQDMVWSYARPRPEESRRASRIECDLWVRVGGVDAATRPRSGNISVTGVYFGIDEAVGSPGDVVWLNLSSIDKARSAQVMGRITRVVRQDDLHRGAAVVAAGFEFLPDPPQSEVVELVRHVTSLALGVFGGVTLDHDHAVRVTRKTGATLVARLRSLGRDHVIVSVPSPLTIGESARIDVSEPGGGQIHVHGKAVACEPDYSDSHGQRFAVVVRFAPPDGHDPLPRDEYVERAVESLLGSVLAPTTLATARANGLDLSGQLSRVHLTSLLSLAEVERLDAIITVANESNAARIYVSGGRVIDAEFDQATLAPRDVVAELIGWTDGEFSVMCTKIRRADRFETTTSTLLQEITREREERLI